MVERERTVWLVGTDTEAAGTGWKGREGQGGEQENKQAAAAWRNMIVKGSGRGWRLPKEKDM